MDDKDNRKPRRSSPRDTHRRPAAPARPRAEGGETGERIAKRLARAGVASRREAESMIAAGRISVGGRVIDTPALNVTRADRIEIDGRPIPEIERTRLFLFHKPAGHVTTNRDPEGRPTVFDILPEGLPRLMTVGRLDMNTEGLLLLTNDGGLARVLELPSTGWLRRYRVRVHGEVDEAALAGLRQGIAVDGVYYGAIDAALDRRQGTNAWLTLGLREGKNREVRNVLGALGLEVTRLIRVSYGPFQLGELPERAVLELKGRMLRDQLGARLIEEAGADFEAPVATAFSNKPVASERDGERAEKPRRERASVEPGEGGLIKRRRPGRQERRDSALERIDTKPGRFASKPRGEGPRERGKREEEQKPVGRRNVNVWMAPGARPKGPKGPVSRPDRPDEERKRPPRGAEARAPVSRRAPAEGREDSTAPERPRPERKAWRPGKAERQGQVYQPKGPPRDEANERRSGPKPFGEKRRDGERPGRDEKRREGRPAGKAGFGRPRGDDDRRPGPARDGERREGRPAGKPDFSGPRHDGERRPGPASDGERREGRLSGKPGFGGPRKDGARKPGRGGTGKEGPFPGKKPFGGARKDGGGDRPAPRGPGKGGRNADRRR